VSRSKSTQLAILKPGYTEADIPQ